MQKLTLFLTGALGIAQVLFYYPQLPETVPIHFNISGAADRWAGKEVFFGINIVLFLFNTVLFYGIMALIKKGPDWMLNISNKEYWLSPENEAATRDKMASAIGVIGYLTNIFFIALLWMNVQTAISGTDRLSLVFPLLLFAYLVIISVVIFRVIRYFYKIPGQEPPGVKPVH